MASLVKRRGTCKTKLTLFGKFMGTIKERQEISDVDILQIQERLHALRACKDEFEEIQLELETGDETNLEAHIGEREIFENTYYDLFASAQKIIQGKDPSQSSQLDVNNSQVINSPVNLLSNQLSNVKLPTIALPKFNGNYENWLEFRDTFESLINQNFMIGSIQKFHYLKASLEGDAAEVIKSLELSEANYEVAWGSLLERYNSDKLLIQNHVRALFNLEPVTRESASALRKMFDDVTKNLRALEQLGEPVSHWDTLLTHLVSSKLDKATLGKWEDSKAGEKKIKFDKLKGFLKARADVLEAVSQNDSKRVQGWRNDQKGTSRSFLVTGGMREERCVMCNGNHSVATCDRFGKLNVKERIARAKEWHVCLNCLKKGHYCKQCRQKPCPKCHEKHNTLLHTPDGKGYTRVAPRESDDQAERGRDVEHSSRVEKSQGVMNQKTEKNTDNTVVLSACNEVSCVLLSTVQLRVTDAKGKSRTIRALLDNGSQSSFITEDLCEELGLITESVKLSMKGINQRSSNIHSKCKVVLESLRTTYKTTVHCYVIKQITGCLPQIKFDPDELDIPKYLELADPDFFLPNTVGMLIGCDLYYDLLCEGMMVLGTRGPVLHKTQFDWVVTGPIGRLSTEVGCYFSCNTISVSGEGEDNDIRTSLAKFWEIEEVSPKPAFSAEEQACEEHFADTTRRDKDGRFIVSIPLRIAKSELGESRTTAEKRFISLESKFAKRQDFKMMYVEFMREYDKLGHMSVVTPNEGELHYYMPHSGILREESLTTKLRVVFDASAPTSSGYSLNHLQMTGPTLQEDLLSILLRFRQHKFVVAADIAKMYRQVLVEPEQRHLQRVLWRENPEDELKSWELKTVTYGTTAASFLVIRCMFQLAKENEHSHPNLCEIIRRDFYVDDLLTGGDTIEEVANICSGVQDILKQGCFELRKFYSNEREVLKNVMGNASDNKIISFGENENAKTLGIRWCPSSDTLQFNFERKRIELKITKRTILSGIAQIFDPLGLLGPCIISVKILMQRLWLEKLTWDEPVSQHVCTRWRGFIHGLEELGSLRVDRRVVCNLARRIEIHGFSDASEAAYGGCIYLKSIDEKGNAFVKLLCAKSKVAPLKTVTLPRLELLGAVILTRLARKVKESLRLKFDACTLWSDSTVVLGWLKTPPNKLKPFVSNRVSEIQQSTAADQWRHVSSGDNPADCLSRGITPKEIVKLKLWWHGPAWLEKPCSQWPAKTTSCAKLPDLRKEVTSCLTTRVPEVIFDRYSDLSELQKVVAWIFRFYANCRANVEINPRTKGPLTLKEVQDAFSKLIKLSQQLWYSSELVLLQKGKGLDRHSKVLNLNPFIDDEGLLRVGVD